jgi:hypothetical protein
MRDRRGGGAVAARVAQPPLACLAQVKCGSVRVGAGGDQGRHRPPSGRRPERALEGGGRLVVELKADEANELGDALKAVVA